MENTKEIWKPVVGYEGFYEISSMGRVRSLPRDIYVPVSGKRRYPYTYKSKLRYLKTNKLKDGYVQVHLSKNGEGVDKKVHRLIAEAFIPNPDNKPQVM